MININEYRHGNYYDRIKLDGSSSVWLADFKESPRLLRDHIYSLSGIELTEEWVLKFGFATFGDFIKDERRLSGWKKNGIQFEQRLVGSYLQYTAGIELEQGFVYYSEPVKYIHQLQNLYFALTQTELTVSG